MDALEKIFDELRSRIRSPIWGTIGLYVILLNWKAFYFLLFADASVPEKFSFWDENVTHEWLIYYPLALGVDSVVTVPWIRLGLTWVNRSADLKLHNIQSTQKTLKDTIDVEADTRLKQAVDAAEAVREQQKSIVPNDCKRRVRLVAKRLLMRSKKIAKRTRIVSIQNYQRLKSGSCIFPA